MVKKNKIVENAEVYEKYKALVFIQQLNIKKTSFFPLTFFKQMFHGDNYVKFYLKFNMYIPGILKRRKLFLKLNSLKTVNDRNASFVASFLEKKKQ